MTTEIGHAVSRAVDACITGNIRSVTIFLNRNSMVRATNNFKPKKGEKKYLSVTIGKPNYKERLFLKKRRRYDLIFPLITWSDYPKKKKKS